MQGFLSEEADNFITNYIYPAFSPTLGVFLAISVVYGLVKVRLSAIEESRHGMMFSCSAEH